VIGKPLLDEPPPAHAFAQGTWGPEKTNGFAK
jgi:hypothetical protein